MPLQNVHDCGLCPVQQPASSVGGSVGSPAVVDGVGSGVGGVHSGAYSLPSIHEHSSAIMHAITSSMFIQNDHVRGEFPAQQPTVLNVGAGAIVVCGGSVGGWHSSGSSVTIHEHTPADSHSAPLSIPLQNENVRAEYPVQQPSS